jgi:hypothetical protein
VTGNEINIYMLDRMLIMSKEFMKDNPKDRE